MPTVIDVGHFHIAMTRIPAASPTARAAERLGRQLADLHAAGSTRFGAPWSGYIGPLPMDNSDATDWASFYRDQRVRPFLESACRIGTVNATEAEAIEAVLDLLARLPGSEEPPSRIHGDLWSGNVLWTLGDEASVVDPAAHGGHRETDLAMLTLFGAPFLDRIISAYHEHRPLADGWPERVGIHQLHPLLVHAVLFGTGYGRQAGAVATEALRIWA